MYSKKGMMYEIDIIFKDLQLKNDKNSFLANILRERLNM